MTVKAFIDAAEAFAGDPGLHHIGKLTSTRLRLVAEGLGGAPLLSMLRVLLQLAAAAQEHCASEERMRLIASAMTAALAAWRADLGEHALRPPSRPPAPIRQYKDE